MNEAPGTRATKTPHLDRTKKALTVGAMTKFFPAAALFIASVLAACSGPRTLNTVALNPDRGTKIVRDVAYGTDPRQKLDIYIPDTEGPHPVLVFIHGGSWSSGSKGEYAFAGKRFAALGFVTAVINYRMVPDGAYPVFMEDTGAAVAFIHAHAGKYQGIPDRLFITGHSAGAYNAVQVAVAPEFLAPHGVTPAIIDGVVGLAGPYDFLPSKDPDVIAAFGADADPKVTMPAYRATPGAPPMLLIAGGEDDVVWPHNAPNMAAALEKVGTEAVVKVYPTADHAGTLVPIALPRRGTVAADVAAYLHALP